MTGFSRLVADLDYPMAVATTVAADGERSGCLVGFHTQVSIDPARFLVCISVTNHTAGVVKAASTIAVHFLDDAHRDVAELFGGATGDEVDKFEQCRWQPGPGGVPVLDDCASWFAGRIVDRIAFGDHTGYVLEPIDADAAPEGVEPSLSYQQVKDIDPGHAP